MLNITRIPAPRVMLVDPQTGIVSDQWFRFLNNIYTIVGANLGVVQIVNGGTGLSTVPTNGQLLIGDAVNGYTLNTLTPASGIGITNGAGAITIANTGVLSNLAGSGVSVSGATGDVTIANTGVLSFNAGTTGLTPSAATTGDVTLAGTLAVANGGTGVTTSTGTGSVVLSAAPSLTGGVTIGTTSDTSAITFGQTTVSQTTNIQAGINTTGTTKAINIGTNGGTGSTTTIVIGSGVGNITTTMGGSVTATGNVSFNGGGAITTTIGNTNTTGTITLGRPTTVSQTINIANAVLATGNTQTINIGASGAAGSTTNTTIGSTAGTSIIKLNGLVNQQTYTVATLPTGIAGSRSFVTDALAPAFGAAVTGGGAVGVPVYHDGTSWKVG